LAKKLETAWTTSVERNKRCEDELSGVRQERDSLKTRLAEKEQSVIDFKLQIAELEERLKRQMTEVKRLNAIRASQQNGHSKDAVAAPANPNNRQTEPKEVPVEQRGASQRKVCEPLKSSEDRSCNSQLLGGNAYDLKP
jgi:chromosome segregation ATPase